MIESHSDRPDFLADLKISLFCTEEETLENIKSQLNFSLNPDSTTSIFLPETMTVDWDFLADEALFVYMSEMVGKTYVPGGTQYEAPEDKSSEWSALGLTNCYLRVKAIIEVERRFEWDFDDEEAMEYFDEKVNGPFYEGLELNFGELKITWYDMACYSNP